MLKIRPIPLEVCFQIILLSLVAAPLTPAQDAAAAQTDKIFLRAADLADIRVTNQAFELQGRIAIIGKNGKSQDGTYMLLWTSQTRWHEEINLLGYRRIRFGDVGKYWQVRNTAYEPEAVRQLDDMLRFVSALRRLSGPPVATKQKKLEGEPAICAETSGAEYCFDSKEGALIREQWRNGKFSALSYENYMPFGTARFPRTIRTFAGHKAIITFDVDKLVPLPEVGGTVFTHPESAESWEFCSNSTPPMLTNRELPRKPDNDRDRAGTVTLYGVVASDGTLQKIKVLDSSNENLTVAAVNAVQKWKFKPAMCGDTLLRTETQIDVLFGQTEIETVQRMFDSQPW